MHLKMRLKNHDYILDGKKDIFCKSFIMKKIIIFKNPRGSLKAFLQTKKKTLLLTLQ